MTRLEIRKGSAPSIAHSVLFALVLILLPVGGPRSVLAQEEEIRAREGYYGLRLYSGGGVNFSERLELARMLGVQALSYTPGSVLSPRWRALGPEGTIDYLNHTSARVSSIAIHPTNPDIIYIGAAGGGVWRTDDAGASWRPLTDNECSLSMGSVAIDPVNPDIVYAGTGEARISYSSYYGCGVLRSLNGGLSWEQLGGDVFIDPTYRGGARVRRVLIDPVTAGSATSTVVMAASDYGLFRSSDSGRTWNLVLETRGVAPDVAMKPGDPSVVYAGIPRSGIYRSVDAGVSWSEASPDFADDGIGGHELVEMNLAVVPFAPDVLYASVAIQKSPWLVFYRSDDGAETWRHLEAAGSICKSCGFMALTVHPEEPDRVYYGEASLNLSEDGGRSFSNIRPSSFYVDQQHIVFDTLSGRDVVYFANDGGVYRSDDGGLSATSLSTNLAITQFYPGIALHPWESGVTLGGSQDQGTQRSSAGSGTWTKVVGGDGGYAAFDAEDPGVWYAETQWGGSWGGPRKNGSLAMVGIDPNDRALFIPPLVMDPVDSRRLYFGTSRLYRTDDAAGTWAPLFESPDGMSISAIAPSASDPNSVYLATGATPLGFKAEWRSLSRGVYVTRDGGATWSDRSTGLPAARFIGDLAVHPTEPDRAYAVVGGFLTGHVFETTDGGTTWRDRTGNLPDMPVNAVIYDPADDEAIYIGTDLGVYYSSMGGDMWTSLSSGLPNVPVLDIAAQPGTGRLVASTIGRGMFEIPIEVPLAAGTRPVAIGDMVYAAMDTTVSGTVIVAPVGRDDYAAAWSASASEAPWLALDDAEGAGRGRFGYRIAPGTDLGPGDHEATITVRVAGTDPITVPVEVRAEYWSRVAIEGTGARTSVPAGHSEPVVDSLGVTLTGARAAFTDWTATRTGAGWAELVQAAGTGSGTVSWLGDVSSLSVGVYVDTVLVAGALADGSPVVFVDTLAVEPPLSLPPLQTADGIGVAGLELAPGHSVPAGFGGFGADSASWIAETASSWVTLDRTSGNATEPIAWSRSAELLEPGVHEDTITIRVAERPELHGIIVDRFEVHEPIPVEDAVYHLLGLERLLPGQSDFLDWMGNRDDVFNAGDVLRWLDHCRTTGAGCGPEAERDVQPATNLPARRP